MTFSGEKPPAPSTHTPPHTQPPNERGREGAEVHTAPASRSGLPRSFCGGLPASRPRRSLPGIRTEPAPPLRRGSSPPESGEPRGWGAGGCSTAAVAARGWGWRGCAPPHTRRSPRDLASTSTGPRSAGVAARPVAAGPGGRRGDNRLCPPPPPPSPGDSAWRSSTLSRDHRPR